MMRTYGPEFEEPLDGKRVRTQMLRVRDLMLDGNWRTLEQISWCLGRAPQASVIIYLTPKSLKTGRIK